MSEAHILVLDGLACCRVSPSRWMRGPADIDEARMPPFQVAYLRWAFSGSSQTCAKPPSTSRSEAVI